TEQLMQVYRKQGGSVIAVLPADEDDIPKKGIVGGGELDANGVMAVSELVEKPALEDAPSNQAIVARYVLDNRVFDYLVEERAGAGGEIQITDAIESLLGKSPVHARQLEGFHADTGNPQGMLDAAVYVESRNNPTSAARLKSIIDS
ncbi:MAG: sugar phosphate nucleotidyltransferase, partial [Chloroflexota bacterium]